MPTGACGCKAELQGPRCLAAGLGTRAPKYVQELGTGRDAAGSQPLHPEGPLRQRQNGQVGSVCQGGYRHWEEVYVNRRGCKAAFREGS